MDFIESKQVSDCGVMNNTEYTHRLIKTKGHENKEDAAHELEALLKEFGAVDATDIWWRNLPKIHTGPEVFGSFFSRDRVYFGSARYSYK